jgi:hypothetical protein
MATTNIVAVSSERIPSWISGMSAHQVEQFDYDQTQQDRADHHLAGRDAAVDGYGIAAR